jgi:hypothetical protein
MVIVISETSLLLPFPSPSPLVDACLLKLMYRKQKQIKVLCS